MVRCGNRHGYRMYGRRGMVVHPTVQVGSFLAPVQTITFAMNRSKATLGLSIISVAWAMLEVAPGLLQAWVMLFIPNKWVWYMGPMGHQYKNRWNKIKIGPILKVEYSLVKFG